jgi:signal transduction histidine kinase
MKTLGETYSEIQFIYNQNDNNEDLSEEATLKMDRLETKQNVQIYIVTKFFESSYPSYYDYSVREKEQINLIIKEYIFRNPGVPVDNLKLLTKTDLYYIFKTYDKQMDSFYIDLVGYLEDGKRVLMRTNFENMQDNVAVSNTFLAYIGILVTIVGTLIMLVITNRFTKPIKDLSNIAKKMSDLDFDVKYIVNSKDEIGELGNSINVLSERLETTISELKSANNELLSDIQQKTEIDEMRKDFLSNVSHELKTPLSLIQGYAEGLKENIHDDEESRNFYCEVIMDEANKMNKMVKKLLTLNQIEFGTNQVNIERFDIVALIQSVLNATDILFKQKEVSVYFNETQPIYVWSDEYLIEEVITNYISNALNHVSGNKIIEIKLIRHDNVIRVAVFNTGDNIPEEDLDKIWIKFYKVDKARTREYGGNGIGLSIVKAIMNSLNKECGVINRPIGVEFWFEVDTKTDI